MSDNSSPDNWVELIRCIEYGLSPSYTEENEISDTLFPLISLEKQYRGHAHYGKIMGALVDLKLTLRFCSDDFRCAGVVYNERIKPIDSEQRDQFQVTTAKITFLGHLNAFILRCRAFWDKAMGALVLILNPDEYKKFLGNGSRVNFFKTAMHDRLTDDSIESIFFLVEDLLNKVRTAEAHLTGTLRTWVFKEWTPSPENTRLGDLLSIYNLTLRYAQQISDILCKVPSIDAPRSS